MKNNVTRLLAFFLTVFMLISAVACSTPADTDQNSETLSQTEVGSSDETDYDPGIDVKDYDCEFIIGGVDLVQQNIYVENMEGDSLTDAIYERIINIQDHLGVTINSSGFIAAEEVSTVVLRTVMTGADEYQLVATHPYIGIPAIISSNCAYDLNELDAVNLDAPYWATEFMNEITINDHYYIGYNDFCLSVVNLIVFNKDMMEEYHIDAPYQTVIDQKWTVDKLLALVSNVAIDNGDNVWDDKDTYGLTGAGWVPLISMVTACDLKMIDKDDTGAYKVALSDNPDKLADFMLKIDEMYNGGYSYLWKSGGPKPNKIEFATGTSLFQLYHSRDLVLLRGEAINFGILPYPKYNEEQENYKSLNWNGLFIVPSSIKNPEMVGEVVELLGYYNQPVRIAFYEDLLGTKISNAPEDSLMLDYIWDSQATDVAVMTATAGGGLHDLLYLLPQLCMEGNLDKYSSKIKGISRSCQKALESFFDQ